METLTTQAHLVREVFRMEKILVDQARSLTLGLGGPSMTAIYNTLGTINGGLETLERLVFGELTEEQRARVAGYLGCSDG